LLPGIFYSFQGYTWRLIPPAATIISTNMALGTHARKGKRNGSPRIEASPEQRKKKDLSKVKCFACHMLGHYVSHCPQRKKGKGKQ
jgi:hypothetical protein